VQFGKMGTYLFAVTPTDTAVLKPVKTGVRYHDLIQIFGDVAPGERVVVLGQFILYPGATVVDVSRMPPAGAAIANHPIAPAKPADKPSNERSTP
jgi:hypothetical protein